jgi:hypothetical protein
MKVKKYNGELVEFDMDKLRTSLLRSGASQAQADVAIEAIKPCLKDEMSTRTLYQLAFKSLKGQSNALAARYSLKRAIRDLGPSGYHFEKWAGRLMQHAGYQTLTGLVLQGKAVTHEIDVLALNEQYLMICECKFRNTPDAKIPVTTPMYFLSRLKDLEDRTFAYFDTNAPVKEGWLITNAYLTKDAIRFGEVYNIHMISWDYPEASSIKRRVDHAGLYPITCLTTLQKAEKEQLLNEGCLLVKDLTDSDRFLNKLRLSKVRERQVFGEARGLLSEQLVNE